MTEIDGVTYKITETQASCFKTAFGIFDSDGDGCVTRESVETVACRYASSILLSFSSFWFCLAVDF